MSASQIFQKYFSSKYIADVFNKKVRYRASVGMDRITPNRFEKDLQNNVDNISKHVLAGTYRFTRYREVLISKGVGKAPRVISIPTVRDKLTLSVLHAVLRDTFSDDVDEPLLQTTISNISNHLELGQYDAYVKVDVENFYASINHSILIKKLYRRIRKKEVLKLIESAITTQTISSRGKAPALKKKDVGVPEGLSISNILANIYLWDLEKRISSKYKICFYRYVDDMLILCNLSDAEAIKEDVSTLLYGSYKLKVNEEKTYSGALADGVQFLGYTFSPQYIGVRETSVQNLEQGIERIFRWRKYGKITDALFIWKLNIKITGCILDSNKYGWLFYYSQLTDFRILYHLDWLVNKLFHRFRIKKSDNVKSFIRAYHEITKNLHGSTYLLNASHYSVDQKREILQNIYGRQDVFEVSDERIVQVFNETMFKEIEQLEQDVQTFS